MIKQKLGNTGLLVSKLCFGTLTLGSIQANIPINKAVNLISDAWDRGVNFFDSAELYDTQKIIGALPSHIRHGIIVATKSYSETTQKMIISVEKSLKEMKLDVIPIYLLHEQETALTFKGHERAFDVLLKYKAMGLIKHLGVSTHSVEITKLTRQFPEIEVVFSMFNIEGWGIRDGTQNEMEKELEWDYKIGKGVYLMKVLAGGKLLGKAKEAITYARDFPFAHAVAIGMKHKAEVDWNIDLFEGKNVPELNGVPRKMLVSFWCETCGICIEHCPQKAISIINGKTIIDENKCITCAYCVGFCPLHCLRVI